MLNEVKRKDKIKELIKDIKARIKSHQKFIDLKNISNKKLSFLITLTYVGLGTIYRECAMNCVRGKKYIHPLNTVYHGNQQQFQSGRPQEESA